MRAKIMPGSVVTKSVPPLAIVQGNPVRIIGYVDTTGMKFDDLENQKSRTYEDTSSKVKGVILQKFSMVTDLRGNLSVAEFEREIPFKPKRFFLVFDVPSTETRGEHVTDSANSF